LKSGPIPSGPYQGSVKTGAKGSLLAKLNLSGIHLPTIKLDAAAETLWKGKHFYKNESLLRNMIEQMTFLKTLFPGFDPEKAPLTPDGKGREIFPAKVYCGSSLIDSRRESIIIDYAFSEDLNGYQNKIDFIAGPEGLDVRDEIRMIRPGFYLGRAYLSRVFALNFWLWNEAAMKDAAAPVNECWAGTQEIRRD
jgi:hypothetical protein